MSENKWKIGDVVRLKSGGPVMTVTTEAEGIPVGCLIGCCWIVGGNAYGNCYPPDAVEHAWLRSDPDKAIRDSHVDGTPQGELPNAQVHNDATSAAQSKIAALEHAIADLNQANTKLVAERDRAEATSRDLRAELIAQAVDLRIGATATPIYGYGHESTLRGSDYASRLSADEQDSRSARIALGAKPGEMAKAVDALKAKLAQSENALTHVNARCYRLEETIDKARKITGTEWGLTLEAAVTRVVSDREAERLKKDTAIATIRTVGLILEAKDGESLNQAATRVRLELSEQSNRRTAAEGRLAEIKRALGNEGLLA